MPGGTSIDVNITITGDDLFENNETFSVNLSNPVNAIIADDMGIGTIIDDDDM